MCVNVIINRGEKEIETPREFKEHFGFQAPLEDFYETFDLDCCLCQVDVEKALKDHNIPYKSDLGGLEIYVGELEKIELE